MVDAPRTAVHTTTQPVNIDAASEKIREAFALVTQARAEYATSYVENILRFPSIYADDPIRSIAFNGKRLYDGEPVAARNVDAGVVAHVAQGDHTLYGTTLRINGQRPPLDKYGSASCVDHGGEWLARALRGDDAAHCALMIMGMTSKDPEWAVFANTATNLRMNQTCAQTARLVQIVADARASDDPFRIACDTILIDNLLETLEAEATTNDDGPKHEITLVADECNIGAISVGRNAWRTTEVADRTITCVQASTRTRHEVARTLAKARHHASGDDMMSIYIDGSHVGRLLVIGYILRDMAEGVALDLVEEHRHALDALLPLMYGPVPARLRLAAEIVDATLSSAALVPLDDTGAVSWLTRLTETLVHEDLERSYQHGLGAHWRQATPRHTIATRGGSFQVDTWGKWRDHSGHIMSWDTFARLTHARRVGAAIVVVSPTSMHREPSTRFHMAHCNPCHAPDLAHGLCRDALAGDAYALHCLAVLSIASPEWDMLYRTAADALHWLTQGHPLCSTPHWTDPLIDWILDVRPHENPHDRFEAAQRDFDAATVATILAKGHIPPACVITDLMSGEQRIGPCNCPSAPADASETIVWCAWKSKHRLLVNENTPLPYSVDTYLGAITARLTRAPLTINGRQILATEAFCPLLGQEGRGVEALVRALYTCEPLRIDIIGPAQLALADHFFTSSPLSLL